MDSTDLGGEAELTTHPTENALEEPRQPNSHVQKRKRETNANEELAWYRRVRIRKRIGNENDPVLHLLSLNGTFERKTITVPYFPDVLRFGRQTGSKNVPTPANGYFDSKVLSRNHAEIWAERNGAICIRDAKSSNGTFINGMRLSPENRHSELRTQDTLQLGVDIVSEDLKVIVHHKVAAGVEHAGFLGGTSKPLT